MNRALQTCFLLAVAFAVSCTDSPTPPDLTRNQVPYQVWGGEEPGTPIKRIDHIALAPDGTFYLTGGPLGGTVYHADANMQYVSEFSFAGDIPLRRLGDIAVVDHDEIYVTANYDNRAIAVTGDGELIAVLGEAGTEPGAFDDPRGVATDAAGNVYIVDTGNKRVQVFDGTGTLLHHWPVPLAGTGEYDIPHAVAVVGDEVFVVSRATNGILWGHDPQVQVFTPEGALLRSWEGGLSNNFFQPRGIEVGPAGTLYILESGINGVYMRTADGESAGQFEHVVDVMAPLFYDPGDLAVDPTSGMVYTTELTHPIVQAIRDAATVVWRRGPLVRDGEFRSPRYVAVGPDDRVYTQGVGRGVQVFESDGTFVENCLPYAGYWMPIGVDGRGRIYAKEWLAFGVSVFDSGGERIYQWSPEVEESLEHAHMAVSPDGRVHLARSTVCSQAIHVFESDGAHVRSSPVFENGGTLKVFDLAVDAGGSTYALGEDAFYVYDPDGTLVTAVPGSRVGGDGFRGPRAIAVDHEGRIFVADTKAQLIHAFFPSGGYIRSWRSNTNSDIHTYVDLAADSKGNVYLADERNDRVVRFEWLAAR